MRNSVAVEVVAMSKRKEAFVVAGLLGAAAVAVPVHFMVVSRDLRQLPATVVGFDVQMSRGGRTGSNYSPKLMVTMERDGRTSGARLDPETNVFAFKTAKEARESIESDFKIGERLWVYERGTTGEFQISDSMTSKRVGVMLLVIALAIGAAIYGLYLD